MTTQETIRTLKMEMLGDSEQMKCAKQIAIEALEKQIPKEPIKKYDCKNCIHDEICPVWDDYNDEPCKDGYRGFCHNYDKFKDKSQYIELPCKVGDKAYKVIRSEHFGNHIQEMTVRKFGMFAHTNFEMIFGMENNWDVFFDKSKAEAKLKEINGNE
nr:MAG TPA: hypothetical protein [Caudoviricetes sp.]